MIIVFDVNGTLLDLHALEPQIRRIFGRKLTVREFFKDLATYAMATSLAGDYRPFEDVARDVLEMNAGGYGVQVSDRDFDRFRRRLRSLPPYPDAKPALARLQRAGLRVAALSNSSETALQEQLKRARLDGFFDQIVSADTVRQFKPSRQIYLATADAFEHQPHELLMVAAHSWDLLGAGKAGYRTALIEREKIAPFPAAPTPSFRSANLTGFVNKLLGEHEEHQGANDWLLAAGGVALGLAGIMGVATCETAGQKLSANPAIDREAKIRS